MLCPSICHELALRGYLVVHARPGTPFHSIALPNDHTDEIVRAPWVAVHDARSGFDEGDARAVARDCGGTVV